MAWVGCSLRSQAKELISVDSDDIVDSVPLLRVTSTLVVWLQCPSEISPASLRRAIIPHLTEVALTCLDAGANKLVLSLDDVDIPTILEQVQQLIGTSVAKSRILLGVDIHLFRYQTGISTCFVGNHRITFGTLEDVSTAIKDNFSGLMILCKSHSKTCCKSDENCVAQIQQWADIGNAFELLWQLDSSSVNENDYNATLSLVTTIQSTGAHPIITQSSILRSAEFAAGLVTNALHTDRPDELFPTVVQDHSGVVLGLCYSSKSSLLQAIATGSGVYHSRKRGVWVKGLTSGNTQRLLHVSVDCDNDALLFTVTQEGGGFCHNGTYSCFGHERHGLAQLWATVCARRQTAPVGSYTRRLFDDAMLLQAKLREEAGELAAAQSLSDIVAEAADVLYFTLVKLAAAGATLREVEDELDGRALRVRRRGGNAKMGGGT